MAPSTFPTHPQTRLPPHPCPVHAVTFSSGSGQYILTGAQDRTIRLFNPSAPTPSSQLVQTLRGHAHEVLDLAVAPDNASLASVGGDKLVFVWDVASASVRRRFPGHAARVNAVAYAGEGDCVLASGSFDGTVRLWDLRARGERPIMSLSEARDSVSDLAVRGGEVFAGSVDGRLRTYDIAAGRVVTDVVAPGVGVTSVGVTAAGDAVLVSSLDSTVRLMDRASGGCLQSFTDAEGLINKEFRVRSCLAMGDSCVISGSEDGRVVVWDVLSGKVVDRVWHRERGRDGSPATKRDVVSAVAWNQLRKQWVSAAADGSVVVWGMGE